MRTLSHTKEEEDCSFDSYENFFGSSPSIPIGIPLRIPPKILARISSGIPTWIPPGTLDGISQAFS